MIQYHKIFDGYIAMIGNFVLNSKTQMLAATLLCSLSW